MSAVYRVGRQLAVWIFTEIGGSLMAVPVTHVEIVMSGHIPLSDGNRKNILNIFHYKRTVDSGTLVMTQVIDAFNTGVQHSIAAALHDSYVSDPTTVRPLDDPTVPPLVGGSGNAGAISGDRLPSYNAVCTPLKTTMRGRSYRGSKHFAPISEDDTLLDQLTAGAVAVWGTAVTRLGNVLSDASGNSWTPCIVSRVLSQLVSLPVTIVSANVNQVYLNKTIGTMRRRKEKTVR